MESIFTFSPLVLATIPITLGLVQVVKGVGLPDRFAPVASIAFGCALVALTGAVWQVAIASGIIVGLSASGLWSGSRAVAQG